MNIIKRIFVGAVLLLCGAGVLEAQEGNVLRLSFDEALRYAVDHNLSLRNAALDVRKAEAARWEAVSTMLPQVKAGFDYSNMCGYEMNFGNMSIPMNPYGTFGLTASIALTAQQVVGVVMNKVSKEMSDISYRQSLQQTHANVKNVYVSILVMEDVVSLLDSSLANMEQLERSTLESVKVGASEQIAADKLSVQVASMRNSIQANRRSLQMLYHTLILQLGAEVDSRLELTTRLDEVMDMDRLQQLVREDFNIADNYNYQLLEQGERLSKDQLLLTWMGFLPTLSAYYQYSDKTYFGKSEGMNMTPPHMLGFSISIPLWQSGTRAAKIREAKISHEQNLNSRKQAEDALRVQYSQLCYDLLSAMDSYQIQKENLDVTKRVFDNITEKFTYGHASNLEVTNASTDIITAQSNYIQAVMSVLNAQVALENLLGK
ncbi:MAG: TolC family protein [Bacteroidales bacterium]|jgi:outer membrane protein TolC|nr:TolC family protein [Bacteroidales bacterium]MBR4512756.1 TolC family protein [Bacteroidales bacterium]MBR6919563.1 TolC family protein [Bacteroidales bacterium]